MMEVVAEGEKKILNSIEEIMMVEIPERIHQNLEDLRSLRVADLKKS